MTKHNIRELTVSVLADREMHLSSVSYANAAALVKSAVVVVSAVTLLSIWKNSGSFHEILQRMLFWALAAMLAGITQITWSQGYVFLTSRIGILDFFTPIWIGMFEVMLFSICDPEISQGAPFLHDYSTVWLLIAGGHLLSCAKLVGNRIYLHADSNFDSQLREVPIDKKGRSLSQAYKAWIIEDFVGSLGNACIMFLAFGISMSNILTNYIDKFFFWRLLQR